MNKSTYDTINEYCNKKTSTILVQAEKDYVLRMFLESYYSAVEAYKNDFGTDPTEEQEKIIMNSLLNDNSLMGYVTNANTYYRSFKSEIETKYQKTLSRGSFLATVFTNVFSNVVYSALLIFLFVIAREQITSWLTGLLS